MPSVLVVCEYPTLSGGERSLLAVLPRLGDAEMAITVACPSQGPLADALARLGVATIAAEAALDTRQPQAARRQAVDRWLARVRFDLVHANSLSMARLIGPVAAARGVTSLGHLRDIVRLSVKAVADVNCNRRLLAVSHATRRFHADQGVEAGRIEVLYNGVDLDQFHPRSADGRLHRLLDLPRDAPLVGAIGQWSARKGLDVLARAIEMAAPHMAAAHWLFIGACHTNKPEAGEYLHGVRGTIARAGMTGRVHWLAWRDDVPELLPELALLVHPARQEPLGRVLLEAAACGLPIIASDVGGTAEIFPAGTCSARLIAPDDPAALAEAMIELAADRAWAQTLAANARQRAVERFSADEAARGLVEHYRAAAALPRAAG